MNVEVGRDLLGELRDAHILHDDRVGVGFGNAGDGAGGFVELGVEDEGVKGDVAFDAAGVQGAHDVGQFVEVEADFGAGGKGAQPKVDGVGSGFDRGVELRPVARGAHDFGFWVAVYHGMNFTSDWGCLAKNHIVHCHLWHRAVPDDSHLRMS